MKTRTFRKSQLGKLTVALYLERIEGPGFFLILIKVLRYDIKFRSLFTSVHIYNGYQNWIKRN